MSNALIPPVRPGSIDTKERNVSRFPEEAFEFQDPHQNDNPQITVKDPFVFKADNTIVADLTGDVTGDLTGDVTGNTVVQFTANENISARDIVYLTTTANKVGKADNDDTTKLNVIGFATADAAADATVNVQVSGIIGGFSGLTAGSYVFLDSTAGSYTQTATPSNIVIMGFAISTTQIYIQIQPIYYTPDYDDQSLGTLHIIPAADRTSGAYDLTDSSVTTTWETADFSALLPSGTKGVLANIHLYGTASNDYMILLLREDGSAATDFHQTNALRVGAQLGAAKLRIGIETSIKAPNGIFDYAENSTSQPINSLNISLRGYYI